MANVDIQVGKKDSTFFSANPTLVLKNGQLIYNETTSELFIGDGVTQLSSLTAINGGGSQDLQSVTDLGANTTNQIQINSVNVATVNDIVQVNTSTIGSAINGATSATPNDTDLVMSVDTSVAKKNTWTQIKAFLKSYFDTVYITNVVTALGFTPENVSNKSDSYTVSSSTTYATTKSVVDGLATKQNTLTNPVTGTGTTNQITYMTGTSTIGSLSTATYPSLTELSYVKGVTSAIQTQLNNRRVYFQLGQTGAATFSPADATTYYFGMISTGAPATTSASRALIIPNAITIKEISISVWVNTTIGSNESGTFSVVEMNGASSVNTTSFDTTFTWDSANKQNSKVVTGLNISIAAGNYVMIKYDSPTWATNPTNAWATFMISATI